MKRQQRCRVVRIGRQGALATTTHADFCFAIGRFKRPQCSRRFAQQSSLFAISIGRAVWPLDGVNETASVKATRAEGSRKESGRRAEGSRKEAGRKCEESKAEVEDWRRKEQMAANQRISSRESWQLSCSLLRLLSGPRLSRIPKESPKNPQRILFKSLSKISLNL